MLCCLQSGTELAGRATLGGPDLSVHPHPVWLEAEWGGSGVQPQGRVRPHRLKQDDRGRHSTQEQRRASVGAESSHRRRLGPECFVEGRRLRNQFHRHGRADKIFGACGGGRFYRDVEERLLRSQDYFAVR